MSHSSLLKVQNLHGGYAGVEVLRGVSLHVAACEIVALLGSNGAGKSTFNNVICGIYPAWSGQVTFDGHDLSGAHYTRMVESGLIHVPEGRKVFPNLSVQDNLILGSYLRGRDNEAQNLERAYAIFPRLKDRRNQLAGTLSGGEQQMLAIGRGLMSEPKLLILDEPSLGLSPLLVEQNVAQSLLISSRAYVLENGAVRFSGTSSELLASNDLRKAYLGL